MTEGVKGQQARTLQTKRGADGGGVCVGVWTDPPPLTPIVLREHKGSCQTLVVSASAEPTV